MVPTFAPECISVNAGAYWRMIRFTVLYYCKSDIRHHTLSLHEITCNVYAYDARLRLVLGVMKIVRSTLVVP